MALILLTKQPSVSRLYDFNFADELATGETIAAVTSVTSTPVGLTVGSTSFSGSIAQVRLSGGTDQTEYLVTVRVTTSIATNAFELEGRLWVEDITVLEALEQAAMDQLVILSDANTCPVLDYSTEASELRKILSNHKRGDVWAASTARQIGDVIIPTAANRNGHRYRADRFLTTGTNRQNGTTEPSWSTTRDSQHTDGNVIWVEDGWDWDAMLWDLTAAAEEAWTVKAGKSINRVDFAPAQGMSISASQLYDHCIKQAERFRSVYCL